ncbi:hypothetical protein HYU50_02420 [Candidatus Woesearchaeota archaeon]|nr:hypothetical protein [Candidatus Woesearchaeota archaeon]
MQSKITRIIAVFLIFAVLLGIMQFTVPYIIGFDGYYNIKVAEIIKEEGFVKEGIAPENTILADNYADIQVLFRILLIPFTFLGLELGAKIAAILFGAIAFTVFFWFLTENRIRHALFWSVLYLFTSEALMYRLMLPRQMPLVISLLLLTIHFLQKRKYVFLFFTMLAHVLLHSSFVFQFIIIIFYLILEKIISKEFNYKIILYPIIGAVAGLILNPHFPNSVIMSYMQIFKVNLVGNLYNVEWKAWTFSEFIKNNILVLAYFIVIVIAIFKTRKINKNKLFFLLLALFFFIYTILSRRMQEYLVPFSIIALALILDDYIPIFDRSRLFSKFKYAAIIFLIIVVGINFSLLREDIRNNTFLHNFNKCAGWMKDNIPENSLVFVNAYAFPYLFFENSDARYTHGIDLTYSYLYDDESFERYMGILQGTLKSDADYIIKDYNPDYVFSGKVKQDVQLFNYIVAHKENYKAVYEDEWCAVLKAKQI